MALRATVPDLYLCNFFTPPVAWVLLRAASVASCFRGALPLVELLAVFLLRAILKYRETIFIIIILLTPKEFYTIVTLISYF